MSVKVLLATRNARKLREVQRILDDALGGCHIDLLDLDAVPRYEEVPETGLTFRDNALIKAREGAWRTGLPTVADDSGLVVDALGGMPGVFSARWCGRHGDDRANLELVLAQLSDVADPHRLAAFVCTAALALPHGPAFSVEGRMRGRLVTEPRGGNVFGYDPIFVADNESRTNAELTAAEKDAISHRGQAFRALAEIIATELNT